MDIDEILKNLTEPIQMLEDLKTNIIEMQEETVGMIPAVEMWFEQQEAKGE